MLSHTLLFRRIWTLAVIAGLLIAMFGIPRPSHARPAEASLARADDGSSQVELRDILAQLPGMIDGLVADRADMLRCPDLAGGTIGTNEYDFQPGRSGMDEGDPLTEGDGTNAPRGLPDQVSFRSTTQTYNRRFQFAVAEGTIWYKSNTAVTGIEEPWAHLDLPRCFEGKVVGISADDDEMLAVDEGRWVYGMDGALRAPQHFNWSMRWGRPFWTGPGVKLPSQIQSWSWSVVSKLEDGTWSDDAGNEHAVGDGKVSHIWLLNHGGRRLTYMDPWLPQDQSYEMCSPHRGRFRSAAMSASGSTVFVIGRYGDLYTRLYDFDIAGADPLFFDYSYADQRGVEDPVIQLPSPGWQEQPKIPGRITDRISVHKVGEGSVHRELRVEGRRDGRTGYWHKDITDPAWTFKATGDPLVGKGLSNPPRDTSGSGLAPSEDRTYSGTTAAGHRVTATNFNAYCTPARVEVRLSTGERFALWLHTVDNIRQVKRARGLDDEPRMFNGTLEVPPSLRHTNDPQIARFLDGLGEGRFIGANIDGTVDTLEFRHQSWTLDYQG